MEDGATPIQQPEPETKPVLETSWRVVGSAVRGISHERTGLPCQDAQDYRILHSGLLLVAVADGAGTARLSDQGAKTAVAVMLESLETALEDGTSSDDRDWEELMLVSLGEARQAVLYMAEKSEEPARDYACTLTGIVVSGERLVAVQVGDGAVIGQDLEGDFFAATHLQRGEYANETHFLVQEDALEQAVVEIHKRPLRAIAVMSDGLIRLGMKMPSQQPHAPFFQPLFRFAGSVEDETEAAVQLSVFLNSARVNERTDDDKALVLAVRVSQTRDQE